AGIFLGPNGFVRPIGVRDRSEIWDVRVFPGVFEILGESAARLIVSGVADVTGVNEELAAGAFNRLVRTRGDDLR
ncbi:MAG TPA: hypothetical protein DCP63_02210, partial [Bacteroidetes bacterium]|nr:hypothetical protein [Bacteroidota bacterium]